LVFPASSFQCHQPGERHNSSFETGQEAEDDNNPFLALEAKMTARKKNGVHVPEALSDKATFATRSVAADTVVVQVTVQKPHADFPLDLLQEIFILLRVKTGHDFSQYKPDTVQRRIERRLAVHQIETMGNYLLFLQQTPAETEALFHDLLLGATSFFRDPAAFTALEEHVVPRLFADKPAGSVIRVWSPGCAIGEEAYSIAILLQEHLDALKLCYKIQVFATDIDSQAITQARSGRYPSSIAADISPERLARFFTAEPNGSYCIHKNIRDLLIFSEQNVITDPPFSKLDLISCRNLLIYMNRNLQKKLIPLFHYALNPGGFLFLGTSETVADSADLFSMVDRKLKLYQRRENMHDVPYSPPSLFSQLTPAVNTDLTQSSGKTVIAGKLSLRKLTEQALLLQIAPTGALVNGRGDILYLHGRTGMYLEPNARETGVNNILQMARKGFRRKLTMTLSKAVKTKEIVRCLGLKVKTNGDFTTFNLTIRPVCPRPEPGEKASPARPPEAPLYLLVIEETAHFDSKRAEGSDSINVAGIQCGFESSSGFRGEAEIKALKEELSVKEEYLQSANEKLQSTNEELETSKEELQSINEELGKANAELQTKVKALQQAQKMESMDQLAGGVAHDFNNMLGVILGHAEMAMDQLSSNDPLYNSLEEIRRAGERSADITRQLLAFASRQGVVPKGLDLNNASTTKRIGKGTGLGLSTFYGLGKQNNGFINTSNELGQGTTFMTYLPRCASKIEQAQPGEAPDHGAIGGYETILLVEDEATILKMTMTMLHRLGYAVLPALTTQEALRLADEFTEVIHLLVTDVIMPEMNGRDLAKQLLAGKPEMKCLFMSGYSAKIIAPHGFLDEAKSFIQKPFSYKELAFKVREVLKS
jgi:chemotaxis methyl-accepting protein methylase